MTMHAIQKRAMKLDVRSRAKLATKLLHSLDELTEAENEQLWAEEALRRHEQLLNGKAKSRPASEVFRNARERLK